MLTSVTTFLPEGISAIEGYPGFYNSVSFNPENFIGEKMEDVWTLPDDLQGYGVCDDPEDVLRYYDFENDHRLLVVFFTEIRKEEQPAKDGFRFSKWGPYIGSKPLMGYDYIYDEPNVQSVLVWAIYEVLSMKE